MSNPFQKPPLKKNEIEWAIEQTKSMTQASQLLHTSYNTFRKYAKLYELWNPNQSGRGIRKPKNKFKKQSDPMMFWRDEEEIKKWRVLQHFKN